MAEKGCGSALASPAVVLLIGFLVGAVFTKVSYPPPQDRWMRDPLIERSRDAYRQEAEHLSRALLSMRLERDAALRELEDRHE